MFYPSIAEYKSALEDADANMVTHTSSSLVYSDNGNPYMSSGNFAVVFKMKDNETGKFFAVKCFTREQERRAESYKLISEELNKYSSSYLAKTEYLIDELFVDSANATNSEQDILIMEWVEGVTLDKYVKEAVANNETYSLKMLSYNFSRLAMWLLSQPFAHGDLKHDNILVRNDGSLVLVDYDGMYVPAMSGDKPREKGTPDYVHPNRATATFDSNIDDFSIASIALSLQAIAVDHTLLSRYGKEDCLLLSKEDYYNLVDSEKIKAISRLFNDKYLMRLYGVFVLALSETPFTLITSGMFEVEEPETTLIQNAEGNWVDKFGVEYSKDLTTILYCPSEIVTYKIRLGTEYIYGYLDDFDYEFICTRGAFKSCHLLTSITIPLSVTEIDEYAFSGCGSLTSIEIPASVTDIGGCAFEDCSSLTSIVIPSSVTEIGLYTFCGCSSLTSIVIPSSVTKIDNGAFEGCSSLTSIKIPKSTKVEDNAFKGCNSLIIERY